MNNTEKRSGLIAGISLIIMALAAGFAYGYAQTQLLNGSVEDTKQNIIDNLGLLYGVVAGWLVILVTDLVVSYTLYLFFKRTSAVFSAITGLIRLAYSVILAVAIWQLIEISTGVHFFDSASIREHFDYFGQIWSNGLILFGVHLVGLGYLSIRSTQVPSWMGWLLYVAGAGYIFVHGGRYLSFMGTELLSTAEAILAIPMALGELMLAVWLIYSGLRKPKSEAPA